MKKRHLFALLWAGGMIACSPRPADRLVLRGTVPGAMDSTEIDLRFREKIEPIKGYIVGEKFELTGQLPAGAFHGRLSMNNYDIAQKLGIKDEHAVKYSEANFFVENGNLTFATPHIDSLPQSFWRYDIRKENNYTLQGSASQEVFDRYRRQTMDLQVAIRSEEYAKQDNRQPDAQALHSLKQQLRAATRDFIASQRNLPVNLYLAKQLEFEPFTYTQADLDAMTGLFADYTDTTADLKKFRETYRAASAYVQGTPFAGGEVYTPKGDTLNLSALVLPGRYTFIDFWASWCSPCRASFPHLRKVYETYGKRLTFLSVSVDKNDADWKQAMKEERLPWQQYCATRNFSREIGKKYEIHSIPTFLIIDPEGKIIFSGHDSNELDVQLGKL